MKYSIQSASLDQGENFGRLLITVKGMAFTTVVWQPPTTIEGLLLLLPLHKGSKIFV